MASGSPSWTRFHSFPRSEVGHSGNSDTGQKHGRRRPRPADRAARGTDRAGQRLHDGQPERRTRSASARSPRPARVGLGVTRAMLDLCCEVLAKDVQVARRARGAATEPLELDGARTATTTWSSDLPPARRNARRRRVATRIRWSSSEVGAESRSRVAVARITARPAPRRQSQSATDEPRALRGLRRRRRGRGLGSKTPGTASAAGSLVDAPARRSSSSPAGGASCRRPPTSSRPRARRNRRVTRCPFIHRDRRGRRRSPRRRLG